MKATKGFSKAVKQVSELKLIKGWLLPRNAKHYDAKKKLVNMESLSLNINLWVASTCDRYSIGKQRKDVPAFRLLVELDDRLERLLGDRQALAKWIMNLRTNDSFYVAYINEVMGIIKAKIEKGEQSDLNGLIKGTNEYKQWMADAGHLMVGIQLINRTMHPLSETIEKENGKLFLNGWCFASMLAAVASGRDTEGNAETALTNLIKMGAIDIETDYRGRLEVCKYIDSEYLQLINDIKKAFDEAAEKSQSH